MEDTNIGDVFDCDTQELNAIIDISENKNEDILLEDNTESNNDISKKTSKRKNKEFKNKIICEVNYNLPKKNKTSILYSNGGTNYSVFIDGIYEGTLEIEYVGKEFSTKNIKKINIL